MRRSRLSVSLLVATLALVVLPASAGADEKVFNQFNPITFPDVGNASPYPSTVAVSGMSGNVSRVTVNLSTFTKARADDVDLLLVSPGGKTLVLMSDAWGNIAANATIGVDDGSFPMFMASAPNNLVYAPTNYGGGDIFGAPAPGPPYGTTFAGAFRGVSPNGNWQLFGFDDFFNGGGPNGSIQFWQLSIETAAVGSPSTLPPGATSSQLKSCTAGTQRIFKTGVVKVCTTAEEAGTIRGSGELAVGGVFYKLKKGTATVTAGGQVLLKLGLTEKAKKAVRARVADRKSVKARVTLIHTDAGGDAISQILKTESSFPTK